MTASGVDDAGGRDGLLLGLRLRALVTAYARSGHGRRAVARHGSGSTALLPLPQGGPLSEPIIGRGRSSVGTGGR